MEDKKFKISAIVSVILLVLLLIILRVTFGNTRLFILICGADTAVITAIIGWMVVRHVLVRRRDVMVKQSAAEGELVRLEYSFLRKVAGLPNKFRYEELELATDNFRSMLGRGASASVFKGILDDGTAIAVKRIDGSEYGEREFRSEVTAIASVQHVNLVRLLGYCYAPVGRRLLVYEFVPNGSLDSWIFAHEGRSSSNSRRRDEWLPWTMRFRVAIDVAKALAYLHHDCRARILHLDVKPENILLDENFRACVSDFGLSKLMGKDESRVITTVRGTRGYLAPEWLLDSGISEKSDIYSYGMVLLELVGGRRNVCLVGNGNNSDRQWSYFPKIVMQKAREGKLMEVVDKRVVNNGGVEEREVRILVHVALWCIQEKARLRPSMARVVDMLEGRIPVDMPPETEMIIVDLLSIEEQSSPSLTTTLVPPPQSEGPPPYTSVYSFAMSAVSGR